MLLDLYQFVSACWLYLLIVVAVSYLLGSISSAIIVTKLYSKDDIRNHGSGNAGATNVLRSQGAVPALLTTLGDLAKSVAASLFGQHIMNIVHKANLVEMTQQQLQITGMYLAGLCCIIGHLYPVFFGFRGGKGVLATLGMCLILDWRVALLSLLVFILVVLACKMVSAGSIIAALSLVLLTYLFRQFVDGWNYELVLFCTLAAALIAGLLIFKHIPNIQRILSGTEHKITFRKSSKENHHG